jgi:uncharacterized protein (DUF433 family)
MADTEFPLIEYRLAAGDKTPYVRGHRTPVWMVALLARDYDGNVPAVAEHLGWPEDLVRAALAYAEKHPDEIEPIIAEASAADPSDLRVKYPGLRWVKVAARESPNRA